MTQNSYLVQRLAAIQSVLMAQHLAGQGLPNATIGDERETFLREFLQKLFPSHRRFATGVITDSDARLSGQIDIAVEYGFLPSFPMPSTEQRLLLAESVALTIEVKSDLIGQWDQVRETTKKIKELRRHLNPIMTIGSSPSEKIPCIAVGYKGHTTIEGLKGRLASTPESERPDGALVIESGCFIGFGMSANGSLGLYALCSAINSLFTQLGFATSNLDLYVRNSDAQ